MLSIDLQGSYACGIINGRVLESTDLLSVRAFKSEELHINLDMMARHLFLVTVGLYSAFFGVPRQGFIP